MELAAKLIEAHNKRKEERRPFDSVWQEIADWILPNKADFNRIYGIGQKRRQHLYDDTGEHSLKIFASSIIGFLANPTTEWFSLSTTDEEINEDQKVKEWLEYQSKITLNAFNQSEAKFYGKLFNCLLEIGAFGTCSMSVHNTDDRSQAMVWFRQEPIKELYIEEGFDQRVEKISREYKMTGFQLMQMSKNPAYNWKLPSKVTEGGEKAMSKKWDVICCIQPLYEKQGNKTYEEIYIFKDTKEILFRQEQFENPYAVARWERVASDIYGRGPGHVALPDVKTVNMMAKAHLIAADKIINPVLQTESDGSYGHIDLSAGNVIFTNGGRLEQVSQIGNIGITLEMEEQRRNAIRTAFYVDQLQLASDPNMTATEVLARQDEKGRLLAPAIGMIQDELIGPIVERTAFTLMRKGYSLPIPDKLRGKDIKVVYQSPLTRAQRRGDMNSIIEFMKNISGIAQVKPEVLDRINADRTAEELHRIGGVPVKVLNSDMEVDAIRKQREEQMAIQQMAEMAQMQGVQQ